MAHYAFLDENNIVTEVIVGIDEGTDNVDWEQHYGSFKGQTCKRTSYNTFHNEHKTGGTPFRGNYAGIGFTYDETLDVFIPPKPFNSWVLNTNICDWEAPTPYPTDGNDYDWDEDSVSWVLSNYPEP